MGKRRDGGGFRQERPGLTSNCRRDFHDSPRFYVCHIVIGCDVRSAVRWVKENANGYPIDLTRVVVAGASAGGHLAASTVTIETINEDLDRLEMSPRPDALVLFYPCINTAEDSWFIRILQQRVAVEKTSPYHNLSANMPPTIIFHGTRDTYVPYWTVQDFQKRMTELGNICERIPLADGITFY